MLSFLIYTPSCKEEGKDIINLNGLGGKKYGGTLTFMAQKKITSLTPIESTNNSEHRVISQIFETLFIIDSEESTVVPRLAESFSVSDDAMSYTIKIRKGVFFHKDKCFKNQTHELKAQDVKFTLDLACSGLRINNISHLLIEYIKGAKKFNTKTKQSFISKGVDGIRIIDDYTLKIELCQPFSNFEKILTAQSLGIIPKEAYKKYGDDLNKHPIGTGPFQLSNIDEKIIVLKRNNKYWRKDNFGNQLPFISKVNIKYTKNKRSELLAFTNALIDLVLDIPAQEIEHILGSLSDAQKGKNVIHKVQSKKSLNLAYIEFNCNSKEFDDLNVRKAFNLAINRDELINTKLEGEGWVLKNGFVPSIQNYPNEKINGHQFDITQAKNLMKKEGYSNGDNFPDLDLYVNTNKGSLSYKICRAISNQIKKNLGINLIVKPCGEEEFNDAIKTGKAKIWKAKYTGDYPAPENFLRLFYKNKVDTLISNNGLFNAFKSNEYDSLFMSAICEQDEEKRNSLLLKCDQMIVDEAILIPILNEDHTVMINRRLRDFKSNSMGDIDLSEVYIKEYRR